MHRDPLAQPTSEGSLLWQPSDDQRARAQITRYLHWLEEQRGLTFNSYEELWHWSVTDLEAFWSSIWDYFAVQARRPPHVLADPRMPGARWAEGATLNYAEHALRRGDDHPAVIFGAEGGSRQILTYAELQRQVAAVAGALQRLGVRRGDRVVAYLPNIPQTLVAFLATASLGAIWATCSPDFGTRAVVDRFRQVEPRVLFAVDGYRHNGAVHDRRAQVAELQQALPSLTATVLIPYLGELAPAVGLREVQPWDEVLRQPAPLRFEPVPFDHPLWVLYSSGTTGLPKGIVHGHGGILLEHFKSLALHMDLGAEDRFFWYTTTGWMMWNLLMSGLLVGATVVMYDGSPAYPDLGALWRFARDIGITYFGTSAPYLLSCAKAGIEPGRDFDLGRLRAIGSTGAPLPPEGFRWVYEHVKRDLLLGSVSGGTDVCTGFVASCALLPVYAGEIQCRCLGAKVEAFDPAGHSLVDEVGELVVTAPLPSMPLHFWNDPDGRRYQESYFDMYPGVWRHGDWIKITRRGSCIIYGRSDSTLNRGGVRMGTSEFYRVVEELPEVQDSLVIDTSRLGGEGRLLLFVVLRPGAQLDDVLKGRIAQQLRRQLSPRHVPDEIHAVQEVPRTLNGKKLEVPVKRILTGTPPEKAVSAGAVANPDALRFFVEQAGVFSS
jgi:acetoacetyl-CoA synthetase